MKIAAGGLQVQTVHDEAVNRQAQESRRTDYQQKPINDSDNTEALNRNALNKTVEKPQDAAQSFDLPLRLRDQKKEHGRGFTGHNTGGDKESENPGSEKADTNKAGITSEFKLDKYI